MTLKASLIRHARYGVPWLATRVLAGSALKEALAMALTAIAAGHQIQLFVSGTQCALSRPMILSFQVNW